MTHDDDQPNGCLEALDDLMLAVKDAELAGTITADERELLVTEVRGWIPTPVLRCLALASTDPDASLQALRSDDFEEQEGRDLMEGIALLLGAFECAPEKMPALIAGLAAAA